LRMDGRHGKERPCGAAEKNQDAGAHAEAHGATTLKHPHSPCMYGEAPRAQERSPGQRPGRTGPTPRAGQRPGQTGPSCAVPSGLGVVTGKERCPSADVPARPISSHHQAPKGRQKMALEIALAGIGRLCFYF
jgi:hypothetical protein